MTERELDQIEADAAGDPWLWALMRTMPGAGETNRHEPSGAPGSLKECVAYHEAGHAVIMERLGFGVVRVTIVPDSDAGTLGGCAPLDGVECFPPTTPTREIRRWTKAEICATLAGRIAEEMAGSPSAGEGCNLDEQSISDRLALLSSTERGRTRIRRAEETRARTLLRESWSAVGILAEALLKFGTVDGQIVGVIVAPTEPDES